MERLTERLGDMLSTSPDGVAVTDGDLYAYVNPAFARLLGVGVGDLVGLRVDGRMPEEDRPSLRSWLGDPERGSAELRFEHADGSPRLLELTPLRGLTLGDRSYSAIVARDVTRKRRVQADLLVADRMMSVGAIAAGVAHDINNPLSYVLGNLDFVRTELPAVLGGQPEELAADLTEAVEEAFQGAERVRRIVSDLRAFARVDPGTVRDLDVVRVVEAAVNMAFVEIRHRARLEKALQPVPAVRANEARLGQVALNLLLNSVHAMREGQQERNLIRVSTWAEEGHACIEVADNGPGIAPELVGRVFEPFFTTKPRGMGTGLGLAMVHGVVTELGGTVRVESRLGVGTRFVVRLPSTRARDVVVPDPNDTSDLEVPQSRVLVVDDDPLITATFVRALGREGHVVESEEGGEDAMARLERDADFDVVILDLLMPGTSGMDVHRWIASHRPELAGRIVFVSGALGTERVQAFLAGLDAPQVLGKPFELDQVTRLVRRMTRGLRGIEP